MNLGVLHCMSFACVFEWHRRLILLKDSPWSCSISFSRGSQEDFVKAERMPKKMNILDTSARQKLLKIFNKLDQCLN